MNNFDPASYSAWVTVLGGTLGGYVMQDLQLQVRGREGAGGREGDGLCAFRAVLGDGEGRGREGQATPDMEGG